MRRKKNSKDQKKVIVFDYHFSLIVLNIRNLGVDFTNMILQCTKKVYF